MLGRVEKSERQTNDETDKVQQEKNDREEKND